MTPQELKNSILQLAIQGRLVEQRPEEGTAEELYQQIQAEKQQLIKAGKIKKEKPLPEISEDEKPFDIPKNWMWVRLQSIVFNRGQKVPESEFSYIDIGSIDNKRQRLSTEDNVISADKAPSRARKIIALGDILYSTVRPYLHNMCIVDREFTCMPIASTGFAAMTCCESVYNRYLFHYLMSPVFDNYANDTENSKGVAYPAINDDRLYRASIALPPLAEQKRIVAKIEELLPYIDRYEQAWSKLESFNKRFPTDMQKSILQMAIQGKLVEHRPEEGTAEELFVQIQAEKQRLIKAGKIKKQKPLPEIAEGEIPFDIPESWKWVRLGTITSKLTDGSHNPPPNTGKGYPVISAKNVKSGFITFENVDRYTDEIGFARENPRTDITHGDIIMGIIGGSIGNVAIYTHDDKVIAQRSIAIIRSLIDIPFTMILLNSPLIQYVLRATTAGSAQGGVYLGTLSSLCIPLPPLAEQTRIVAKLEEILPLCERLK